MADRTDREAPEAYILSLLAERKFDAAYELIGELGAGYLYASDFSNHAIQAMETGQFDIAEMLFNRAISLDPQLAQAYSGLGILYLRQKKHQPAIAMLQKALALHPDAAGVLTTLGIAFCNSGSIEEGIHSFERALELSPGLPLASKALRDTREALAHKTTPLSQQKRQDLIEHISTIQQHQPSVKSVAKMPSTVSVCMIVKNEEQTLARCLSSVRQIADEIVIVDTGSSDKTVEIAQQFGAKIDYFEWCDDFAAARNYALNLASCDWILIMDADDEIDPGGDAALRFFLEKHQEGDICSLRTRIPVTGGLETFIEHPRLYRNHLGLKYSNSVHEQLVYPDGRPAFPQVATGIAVYHHGYLMTPEIMQNRHERNLRLLHAELLRQPDNRTVLFFLGKEYLSRAKYNEAIPYLRETLNLSADVPGSFLRLKAYSYLVDSLISTGHAAEAEQVCHEALQAYPDHPEILFNLGEALCSLGRENEACQAYEAATKGRFGARLANQDFTCRDLKPRLKLATIALAHNDFNTAELHCLKANAIRPENDNLRKLKEQIDFLRTRSTEMHELETRIAACRTQLARNAGDVPARIDLATALLMSDRKDEARREANIPAFIAFAHTIHDADALCHIADILTALDAQPQAIAIFRQALHVDPQVLAAHVGLGDASFAQRDWAQALNHYETALQRDTKCISAWLGIAKTHLELHSIQASILGFEKAVQFSGGAPEVMKELAIARQRLAGFATTGKTPSQTMAHA